MSNTCHHISINRTKGKNPGDVCGKSVKGDTCFCFQHKGSKQGKEWSSKKESMTPEEFLIWNEEYKDNIKNNPQPEKPVTRQRKAKVVLDVSTESEESSVEEPVKKSKKRKTKVVQSEESSEEPIKVAKVKSKKRKALDDSDEKELAKALSNVKNDDAGYIQLRLPVKKDKIKIKIPVSSESSESDLDEYEQSYESNSESESD